MKEKDIKKELEILESSNLMYENTKNKAKVEMKRVLNEDGSRKFSDEDIQDKISLIEEAQNELYQKYEAFGGNVEELKAKTLKGEVGNKTKKSSKKTKAIESISNHVIVEKKPKEVKPLSAPEQVMLKDEFLPVTNVNNNSSYDVIPLPSKGECYTNKMSTIPVGYLTAYDENLIVAPNLYKEGQLFDYLLKEKIMTNVNPANLLEGDREAIILWLRATGYGNDFPISATDNETGEEFEAVIDLSKIKFKEFKLKGDECGWFDFKLPVSGDNIKFRFLTHQDVLNLKSIDETENSALKKMKLLSVIKTLNDLVEDDESDRALKKRIFDSIRTIEEWEDTLDDSELTYTNAITNRMELCIMSVNGVTDREFIANYVRNMRVKDSSALRRYINDNEPGLDYNIEVEKPASLGGGSTTVFLSLDQFIFLNIAS
jgi:hypothetical protein